MQYQEDKSMNLIVITYETIFDGEASAINRLFERGMETLHLRKPQATKEELGILLSQIDEKFHSRIVLHDHFSLNDSFRLKGVHLNRRNSQCPNRQGLSLSRSCHSLEELENNDDFNYVFLSPVFDSISKPGYNHAFSQEELRMAKERINEKVIALGGISSETIPLVKAYGFGGVAVLGALWGAFPQDKNEDALLKRFDDLRSLLPDVRLKTPSLLFITHQTERYTYLQSVEIALQGGCRLIQLRMKDAAPAEVERTGIIAKALCDPYHAALYIDDQVDVCKRIGAKGVHLGKSDMPPREARRILGRDFIIGGTANTFEDIQHLKNEGVDYIGLGPFRFTTTKKNLSPVIGLEGYRRIMTQCKEHAIHLPVFAIGGITVDDIPEIIKAGVSGIALSSTILEAENPVEETKRIIEKIKI
jgi:thiamine-phosphate pyrophosphorylase